MNILRLFLPEILALLQMHVKNPKSIASEAGTLTEIRDTINQVLNGISAPPQN